MVDRCCRTLGGIAFCRIALFWTLLIGLLAAWNAWQSYQGILLSALSAARHSVGKDITFRRWATGHGGVYVPVSAETPANPYLTHVPERDLVTPSGRALTLINPAYMVRQIHQIGDATFGSHGHITSLRPRRPKNAPDPWEALALQAFEAGAGERWSLAPIGEKNYLRLMLPLPAEEGCLKCHADQGYRVGEIMGGVSVAILWSPYRQAVLSSMRGIATGYGGLWLLGLAFTRYTRRKLQQHLSRLEETEAALRLRSRELEERTGELERFTYTVSHDLKSPLVTVKSFLGFLEQDLQTPDRQQIAGDIGYIRAAAEKMEQLLDELLQLSRIGRRVNPPTRATFQDLVQEALTLTAGRMAERSVEVRVAPVELILVGDRPRLVEIWLNLLDNAVKFLGDQSAPRLELGVDTCAGEEVFFVRDNGIGIEPAYQEKIFGLFERLDPGVPGTGLGLALVKRIVELHKGRIWVESAGPGEGACFRFTLPAALLPESDSEASR